MNDTITTQFLFVPWHMANTNGYWYIIMPFLSTMDKLALMPPDHQEETRI